MQYRNAEDRLNPIAPADADDSTLGGYPAVHGRAPAFEGADGEAYTAAIEFDRTGDPAAPWSGYLVFLRWAATGGAIMGHLETEDLATGASEAEVRAAVEALPLARIKVLLDQEIARKHDEDAAG